MEVTVLLILGIALVAGMAVRQIGLPPLVGYLLAGFALFALGVEADAGARDMIQLVADTGVTLMLFTIGLKLNIRDLIKPEIWAAASGHMLASSVLFFAALALFKVIGFSLITELDMQSALVVAFALSFSSTVFAVKVLDEAGAMNSLFGRIAIGILIMQDLFAVLFMTIASGKVPSVWALALLGLPLLRPLLFRWLERSGHGELLGLYGLFLCFGLGAGVFSLVGIKADLGALVAGMLIASHPKAREMYQALFRTKELFLIAFFLSVGLNGLPTLEVLALSVLLVLLVLPLKTALYFYAVNRCGLKPRTALLSAASLANYSEFGLIVAAFAASAGWLSETWLLVMALSLAISFVLSAKLNHSISDLYAKFHSTLERFNPPSKRTHEEELPIELGQTRVLILGMGRVGTGAYHYLRQHFSDDQIVGIDQDAEKVKEHQQKGRHVVYADATDQDFWLKLQLSKQLELVLLAMPLHQGNMFAAEQLRELGCPGQVAALCKFSDDIEPLQSCGVDAAFNLYQEAGSAFAEDALSLLTGFERNSPQVSAIQSSEVLVSESKLA